MARERPAAVIHPLFFLSGAAGLVYQVVWSRLFNQLFGVTAYAVTAVLVTYLGGLACGGWLLGRAADRARRPLRLYGLMEIGIGLTALAGTWLLRTFDPLHVWVASRLAPSSPLLLLVRSVLAAAVILPPTILMGGTLPALTRVLVDGARQRGRGLSLLYAVNTSGAVAGSLAAGFVLIGSCGVHATLWLAAALNVAVGAASIALGARWERSGGAGAGQAPGCGEPQRPSLPRNRGLLVVLAVSGFASLSLEVLWSRMLVLVVGTSTYAFVTMLTAFLVGIALGSSVARTFVDRVRSPRRAFGWIQAGIAASTLATLPVMRASALWEERWLAAAELDWLWLMLGRFGVSFLVMIVPTTLIGMTFPVAATIWMSGARTVGGRVGQLYAAGTFGNVAGALAACFCVLPLFGMQRGIALVTILNLVGVVWGLAPSLRGRPARWLGYTPVLVGVAAWTIGLLLWRPPPLPGTGGGQADPVRYYREGVVSTVKVVQHGNDGRQLGMFVDGVLIGQSAAGVDRKQQVLAHLPFLVHPASPVARVLSIGLGTGILVGEVARHPEVEQIDCVELSPSVIEGARFFTAHNGNVLEDGRLRVIGDDGVNFLRRSRTRYDAVISDGKSKSGHAGNAVFYSEEYYRSVQQHLAPGGLMIQWVPFNVTTDDLEIILRTFSGVFPFVYVWLGPEAGYLVGLQRPLALDLRHVQRVLDSPAADHLRRHGWTSAAEVGSLLVGDRETLAPWLSRAEAINSHERPVLEFYPLRASARSFPQRVAANLAALEATGLGRAGLRTVEWIGGDPAELGARSGAAADLVAAWSSLRRGDADPAALLRRASAGALAGGFVRQSVGNAFCELGQAAASAGDLERAIGHYREALQAWPELSEAHLGLGAAYARQARTGEAVAHLREALRSNPESVAAHRLLGELLESAGDPRGAVEHERAALRIAPGWADAHYHLGAALAALGSPGEALAEYREAMRLAPEWPRPMDGAALLLLTRPGASAADREEGGRLAKRAWRLSGGREATALAAVAAARVEARLEGAASRERGGAELAVPGGGSTGTSRASPQGAHATPR